MAGPFWNSVWTTLFKPNQGLSNATNFAPETSLARRKPYRSRRILEINPNRGRHRRSSTRVHDEAIVTRPSDSKNALVSMFKTLTEPKKSSRKRAFVRHDHPIAAHRACTLRTPAPSRLSPPMTNHYRREEPPHRAECLRVRFADDDFSSFRKGPKQTRNRPS